MRFRFALCLLLTGCVTTMRSTMNQWVGRSESDLVSEWGAPARTAPLPDGGIVMTWVKGYKTEGDPAGHATGQCERTFTLSPQHVVTKWVTHGCPAVLSKWSGASP